MKHLDTLRNFIQTAKIQRKIDGRMTETDWLEECLKNVEEIIRVLVLCVSETYMKTFKYSKLIRLENWLHAARKTVSVWGL